MHNFIVSLDQFFPIQRDKPGGVSWLYSPGMPLDKQGSA